MYKYYILIVAVLIAPLLCQNTLNLTVQSDECSNKTTPETSNEDFKQFQTPGIFRSIIYMPEYSSIKYEKPAHFKKSATILFWNEIYSSLSHYSWWFNNEVINVACPDIKCHFSVDKNDLNKSDGIVFNTYSRAFNLDGDASQQLPLHRLPHQRLIFFMLEPPELTCTDDNILRGKNHSVLNGFVNWTATHRLDSDIFTNYGKLFLKRLPSYLIDASMRRNFAVGKTKLAAWLVSHSPTVGKREDYVTELQKYIQVDVFGRIGKPGPRGPLFYEDLGKDYKFYLSFENVICKDYATEKLISALKHDMVPVVMGGADYSAMLFAGSYINALDYTPKQLAEYLLYLDENDAEYNKYFDWRRGFDQPTALRMEMWVCEMCLKLMDPNEPPKIYHDFDDWWNRQSNCTFWDKNKIV